MKLSEFASFCGANDLPPIDIKGDRLDLPCCDGQTLLGNATDRGNDAKIKELISRGADPNGIDLRGQTPLIVATLNGKDVSVRVLLEHGASPDAPDNNGRTALMYALYLGHLDIAETLKSSGASQSARDLDGRTAVDYAGHKAAGKDMKSTIEFVKSLGVDPKTVKAKLSPMRSDPDFVTLEYIKRTNFLKLLKLSLSIWASITFLAYIVGWLVFADVGFYLPSITHPRYYSLLFPGLGALIHFGLVFGLGALAVFVLIFWPILWRRRIARVADFGHGDKVYSESAFLSAAKSDSAARGVANILKQGGREAFAGLKERKPTGVERRFIWFCLVLALLIPIFLGQMQMLLLNLAYSLDFPFGWFWLFDWYFWIPFCIAFIFMVCFGLRALASYAFSRALIAKQKDRNTFMSERLDEMTANKDEFNDYVLYLRAFAHDGSVQIGNFDLEAVLAYSFSQVTDVVALGDETGRLGPVELQTDDDEWEERVIELAKRARFIVMVPAATDSVAREVELLKANGLLAKCVFVAPPENKTTGANLQSSNWAAMMTFGIFATLEVPSYLPSGFLFRLSDDGRLESWDALGLQLEPPPIVAGVEFNDGPDSDFSSDFDPSISDGGWENGSLSDMTAAVMAQEQAAMDQSHAHHMHMQNDDWDDHHHL